MVRASGTSQTQKEKESSVARFDRRHEWIIPVLALVFKFVVPRTRLLFPIYRFTCRGDTQVLYPAVLFFSFWLSLGLIIAPSGFRVLHQSIHFCTSPPCSAEKTATGSVFAIRYSPMFFLSRRWRHLIFTCCGVGSLCEVCLRRGAEGIVMADLSLLTFFLQTATNTTTVFFCCSLPVLATYWVKFATAMIVVLEVKREQGLWRPPFLYVGPLQLEHVLRSVVKLFQQSSPDRNRI